MRNPRVLFQTTKNLITMKKLIFSLAALFMMSIVMAGCSDKKSKKDKNDKDDDDERTELVDEDDEDDEGGGLALFDRAPEDKLLSLVEDAVSALKRSHIRTQDDVTELAEKLKPIKGEVETAMKELMEFYKDKDPQELVEIGKKFEEQAEKLSKEAEKEGERLKKEAEEAGVDLTELESLDLF